MVGNFQISGMGLGGQHTTNLVCRSRVKINNSYDAAGAATPLYTGLRSDHAISAPVRKADFYIMSFE
jgi:hypothetical protein